MKTITLNFSRKLWHQSSLRSVALISGLVLAFTLTHPAKAAPDSTPNIILIMVDDMGFSDIGCYGSEVATPNLDRLAAEGLRFTQFYNTGRCCPTRASLLTGLYPHQAGLGHMTQNKKVPGYEGHLTDRCVTIAEVLKPAGYRTLFAGKWHVGSKRPHWPDQRGFDRVYGIPEGGGHFYKLRKGRTLVLDDQPIQPPKDWYTTDAWNDYAMRFIDEAVEMKKPFFLYLAHNAPHWPLQAPPEDIKKYRGRYDKGWDALREERHARQKESGLINSKWKLTSRDERVPVWDSLSESQREELDLMMATYAAMIDRVDQNLGHMIKLLKKKGIFDNTLILFLADNGGCAEGGVLGTNNSHPIGTPESFAKYGVCWANASNTPFRLYKHYVHEGGIATPLIAHWPNGINPNLKGSFIREPGHVIDLMATCADLAQATYPKSFNGHGILPLEGKSLAPIFRTGSRPDHDALYWEHEGNRAVRKGSWKLVSRYGGDWELYNLLQDRTETVNLATDQPKRVQAMIALWKNYAKTHYVHGWGNFRK